MSKEKIAHVILSVPPKKAAEVLKELDEHAIIEVGEAVLKHANISEEQFKKNGKKSTDNKHILIKESGKKSSLEVVKALYKISFGTKKSQDLIKKLLRKQMMKRLSFLNIYKSADILECIKNESPLVISIVLGAMNPDNASQVLLLLPFDTRVAVMKIIAKQSLPDETVVSIVEKKLSAQLQKISSHELEDAGGIKNLSHILQHLPMEAQNNILNQLNDETLKANIVESINSWDIFEKVQTKHLQAIVSDFTTEELASLVIKYGPSAKRSICLGLSLRNQEELEEEIQLYKNKKKAPLGHVQELKADIFERVKTAIERFPQTVKLVNGALVSANSDVEYVE